MNSMRPQMEMAKVGKITKEMKLVASSEDVNETLLYEKVAKGEVVIMLREGHKPLGIGKGLKTKINANIGTSSDVIDIKTEIEKARIAERYGADTISDLSMGGEIDKIRKLIMKNVAAPITTVPIYQTVVECGSFKDTEIDDLLNMVKRHVNDGVSSIVLHAGFTLQMLRSLKKSKRIMGVVSKGGSMTAAWMLEHKCENPIAENFVEFLNILKKKDVVLSLGNTMRSGCIHDKSDKPQLEEIKRNSELAKKANDFEVQTIIEGMGGHVWINDIRPYVKLHNKITGNRPLFVAGPLPIDVAVGYDHVAAAIGGSITAGAGADYLCYITPSEHLSLPTADDVREGVISAKIAAYVGDSIKYGLNKRDLELAKMRKRQDWKGQFRYALECERAMKIHSRSKNSKGCTMCGKYCAIDVMRKFLDNKR
jgi:phosphomethylpyrimidine synthase